MKINFTRERFNSVCDELVLDMGTEVDKNPKLLLNEADSIVAQLQTKLRSPDFVQLVQNIQTGFMVLPFDSVALLIAAGYKMGTEDAKAAGEIAELENLFKKETNG